MTITSKITSKDLSAEDLAITGWALHALTVDGDDWIMTEVLGYQVDYCNVTDRTKRWVFAAEYLLPGNRVATHRGTVGTLVARNGRAS